MPIYAYKCSSCGMSKDILRKISDPVLTLCPECGQEALEKQVTSAGFQLKGSGWYVTDFREGNKAVSVPPANTDKTTDKPSESGGSQANTDAASGASTDKSSVASEAKSTPAAASAASTSTPTPSTPSSGAST